MGVEYVVGEALIKRPLSGCAFDERTNLDGREAAAAREVKIQFRK